MVSGGPEQAGLAQLAREARTVIRNRVWFELENPAAVVHGVKLARIVFAETDDLHRAVGQFATPGELFAVVTQAPELARHPVAVNIGAVQFAQPFAVIDAASRDGRRLGVRMRNNG